MRKRGNLGPFIKYLGKFRTFFKNLQKLGKLGKLGPVGALRFLQATQYFPLGIKCVQKLSNFSNPFIIKTFELNP